jgi:hypothetical protein
VRLDDKGEPRGDDINVVVMEVMLLWKSPPSPTTLDDDDNDDDDDPSIITASAYCLCLDSLWPPCRPQYEAGW